MEKKVLTETAKYLGMGKVKIGTDEDKITVEVGGKKTTGFVCGLLSLVRKEKATLEGSTLLEKSLTHNWLTYCTTDLFHCPTYEAFYSCLKHIDRQLANRAFFCGNLLTIADVAVFVALHPFIINWSFQQKEQYVNISRWFDSMQSDTYLSKTYSNVKFSRTLLYDGTGRGH
ncbi:eukaryotic translation elongation factor 1 epsilon-1-like [Penaeus indicus]|uniref:eukaryotic translation elongation factor 1 epsilon-1-like n=1 Tax=Penaeus indicus TaxID=29960 RepID=UPI00300D00C8